MEVMEDISKQFESLEREDDIRAHGAMHNMGLLIKEYDPKANIQSLADEIKSNNLSKETTKELLKEASLIEERTQALLKEEKKRNEDEILKRLEVRR